MSKLGLVCDVRDGTHDSPSYVDIGFPLITSKNLSLGHIDFAEVNYICEDDYTKINERSKVDKGDILMPMIGTIGNPIIVDIEPCFAIKNVSLIKFKDNAAFNKYIYYLLHSDYFKRYIIEKNRGGTQKFISLKDIREFEFEIPNTDVQHKIAENLDKVTHTINLCNQILEKLDLLVKARFVEMFGDPIDNPKKWTVKKLEEVAILNKGVTYAPEDIADEGMIVLRSSNIKGNEFDLQDLVKITKKISSDKYVQENDILMCNRNGSARLVGKVAKIPKLDENMTFGTFMTIVRSDIYEYLYIFFQLDAFRKQIKFQTAVAINQISLPLLASVKVPIPPTNLIKEFAFFVEQTDKSKSAVNQVLEKAETLKKALMQEYFG